MTWQIVNPMLLPHPLLLSVMLGIVCGNAVVLTRATVAHELQVRDELSVLPLARLAVWVRAFVGGECGRGVCGRCVV